MATVDAHYVAALLRCAERGGQDADALLADVGLTRAQLQPSGARVAAAYAHTWRGGWRVLR